MPYISKKNGLKHKKKLFQFHYWEVFLDVINTFCIETTWPNFSSPFCTCYSSRWRPTFLTPPRTCRGSSRRQPMPSSLLAKVYICIFWKICFVLESVCPSDYRDLDRSDYKNSVIGLSYTFVKVTENKQISLVDTNLNIVC